MMDKTGIKVWVYGRVQGVGFRYSTQQQAKSLGLTGHATNQQDGSVEVVAWGEGGQIDKLLDWLKAGGPASARIDKVLTEPHRPSSPPDRFTTG